MKRVIAVIVATLALVALMGCEKKAEDRVSVPSDLSQSGAYETYVNAVNAVAAAGSFGGDITLKTSMLIMEGEPYEYEVVTGVKHIFGGGKNEAELIAGEGQMTDAIYYRDGIIYFSSGDEKNKFSYAKEELAKMTNTRVVTEVLFQDSGIYDFEANEDSDGFDVRFDVHSADIKREVLLETAGYSMTGGLSEHGEADLSYDFDDVTVSLRFDKAGKMEMIKLAYLMVIDHVGSEIEGYIEFGINLSQVGGVKINFPKDLDSYNDLDHAG